MADRVVQVAGVLSVLFVVNRSRGRGVIGLSYSDSGREGDSSLVSNVSVAGDEIACTWLVATVAQRSPAQISSRDAESNG